MVFKIKKGSRLSTLWFLQIIPFLWINKLKKTIIFKSNCTHKNNRSKWNKLFGFCFIDPTLDSAMFGWTWNPITEQIDISSCCYIKGHPIDIKIASVELEKKYTYTLTNDWGSYGFSIIDEFKYTVCEFRKPKYWSIPFGYTLPLQLSGKTAANDMSIKM
jgi:hypothetical protein